MAERNSLTVWKKISIELYTEPETKSDVYWKNLFSAAKERTLLKVQLLNSLRNNKIEISDDLQMTDIENRILQHVTDGEDQCRVCLERGNDFLSLFKDCTRTPSIIDKLMECSRISQVCY